MPAAGGKSSRSGCLSLSQVMLNGRLYDGNTLDEVYPRQKKLAPQWWTYTVPSAAAGMVVP